MSGKSVDVVNNAVGSEMSLKNSHEAAKYGEGFVIVIRVIGSIKGDGSEVALSERIFNPFLFIGKHERILV